jgi:hypothetical protein
MEYLQESFARRDFPTVESASNADTNHDAVGVDVHLVQVQRRVGGLDLLADRPDRDAEESRTGVSLEHVSSNRI